ncbi:MAG: BtpA/SgcQ family protein [Cyanobacteria bacterium NC_groundwater_1444_Ag_S-0.65um_54_12]|nr:BtpA/SgcQ family protein [Cyanobacteria bacterium NC_groundwater_1444_Ag_S-0.65um_54_12]
MDVPPPFTGASCWPLIGVIHLDPLPGSPNWGGSLNAVRELALRDAEAYAAGGFDAVIVENYGDRPFLPGQVPPATIAALTLLAAQIRGAFPELLLGINVLRNDVVAALSIAAAVEAAFVRANVLVSAMVTDQGVIEGKAWEIAHLRRQLGGKIALWADVLVKHAVPLGEQDITDQASDAFQRAGAAALILSGRATGAPADPAAFTRVRTCLPAAPLLVGSGLSAANLADFLAVANGAIVATSLLDGAQRVDPEKVRNLRKLRDGALCN